MRNPFRSPVGFCHFECNEKSINSPITMGLTLIFNFNYDKSDYHK
jgi:hypothetical protein